MSETPITDKLLDKLNDDLTIVLEDSLKIEETPSETKAKKSI